MRNRIYTWTSFQLIAYAVANFNQAFRRRGEIWNDYWNRWNTLDYNSVYCVYASTEESYTKQPQTIADESFDGYFSGRNYIRHIRATRLAHLAFRRVPFAQQQVLPAIRLSPTQLFQAAYCAFSCTRRVERNATLYPENMACMVILLHSRGLVNASCESTQYQANQPCYYA
nr:uncharacterized protein LOC129387394 [Dermacentor andersoni]